MPNISIVDGFGLDVEAGLNPNSAFSKYLQQLPSFSVVQHDLASLQNVPLAGFPLKSTKIGLTFAQPTTLASTSPQFAGSAALSATLCVVTGGKLFDPDPFASPIEVPSGHAYLGLGLKAKVAPGVNAISGDLTVGFAAGCTASMAHYVSFATTATTPAFKDALKASLQNFVIPLAPDDFFTLGAGDVTTIEGTGSLQLSGKVNLLTAINPLASVTSAALPVTLQIQEGATINVTASCTIEGDFQIRVQKIDAGTVRMGFYKKRGAEFTVQVNPSIGITAGTASADFISAVLGALGPSPFPSATSLEQAGLTKDKQKAIVDALKGSIQRGLALSVQAELQARGSQEAAFLYEISLNDLESDGRSAIQDALRLNLSTLTNSGASLPKGIREIQSLFTTLRSSPRTLKINLLGIYNYTSVSDLILKGTVLTDPASGAVIITDSANATSIAGAVNFLANPDKLRKVLAQSFLITAAYRCSGLIAHAPSLKLSYWHFVENAKTDQHTMASALNVLEKMGLVGDAQAQPGTTPTGDLGHSTFYLNTDYDDALSQNLFLRSDGNPRAIEEYEQIGRNALALLILPGDDDRYRLRALQNDSLWQQVKETGGTVVNIAPIFPDLSRDTQIPIIAGDYVLIEWWANTMAGMGKSLSAAKRFFSQNPPPASDSPAFKKVQSDLWHQMADVARKTHDRFSDPWGLVAMDLASGKQSAASARIVSAALTLSVARTNALNSAESDAAAV